MSRDPLISIGSDAATAIRYVLSSADSAIKLDKRDVALLVMSDDRMRRAGAASLTVDDLREIASIVSRADGGGAVSETIVRHDIDRLVDMRILVRGPGSLAARSSFRLGPVGREIAEGWRFVPDNEAERLDSMLGEAVVRLLEIAEKAEAIAAGTPIDWAWNDIAKRTSRIVGDGLLRPAERRQGQLERWQTVMTDTVRGMLSDRWEEALDACETTLTEAMRVAREMKSCIDRGAPRLHNALDHIRQAAKRRDRATLRAVEDVGAVVDRISDWTNDHFESWTRFVDEALYFIQSVVRADPGRVLSRMIDLQMQAFSRDCDVAALSGDDTYTPWSDLVSRGYSFTRLRDPDNEPAPRFVINKSAVIPLVTKDDTWNRVEDAIRAHIGHLLATTGRADITDVLAPWVGEPILRLSRIAGHAIMCMAAMGNPTVDPSAERVRERLHVTGGLEIDRFSVTRLG
jgi:hypothetical protein